VNKGIIISNVIKSKIKRPDFLIKLLICLIIEFLCLKQGLQQIQMDYESVEGETCNIYMFVVTAFTEEFMLYYSILPMFIILISDIIYEQYLTKNIYVLHKTRRNFYVNSLKITFIFSGFFVLQYLLIVVITGLLGGLEMSFNYTPNAIKIWCDSFQYEYLRETLLCLPKSSLKYSTMIVLLIVILKFYMGLMLLAMIGYIFSIKKENSEYGAFAMFLFIIFNMATMQYNGPWSLYGIGMRIDLAGIFKYITLQRFFIYDAGCMQKDVINLFCENIVVWVVWAVGLTGIAGHLIKNKNM